MNRAAEQAAPKAKEIFVHAITAIRVTDLLKDVFGR
jgi:hypothetical protein